MSLLDECLGKKTDQEEVMHQRRTANKNLEIEFNMERKNRNDQRSLMAKEVSNAYASLCLSVSISLPSLVKEHLCIYPTWVYVYEYVTKREWMNE